MSKDYEIPLPGHPLIGEVVAVHAIESRYRKEDATVASVDAVELAELVLVYADGRKCYLVPTGYETEGVAIYTARPTSYGAVELVG